MSIAIGTSGCIGSVSTDVGTSRCIVIGASTNARTCYRTSICTGFGVGKVLALVLAVVLAAV